MLASRIPPHRSWFGSFILGLPLLLAVQCGDAPGGEGDPALFPGADGATATALPAGLAPEAAARADAGEADDGTGIFGAERASAGEGATQENPLQLSPRGAAAGTEVRVTMDGLPPSFPILVGFGGVGTPHEILGEARTTPEGEYELTVTIPQWAEANRVHLFYIAYADQRPRGFSDPFIVTGAGGSLRVTGEVTGREDGCTLVRGAGDAVYALSGGGEGLASGAQVVVEGVVTPEGPCARGIPVQVREVRPAAP